MTLFKNKYRAESHRLEGYNYSKPGIYYVTIVTQDRENLFGEIINGEMVLNDGGKIARKCWMEIPQHFPMVILDEFIIMPNHVHGIIVIIDEKLNTVQLPVDAQNFAHLQVIDGYKNHFGPQSKNLASIIRGFKIGVTKWFRQNTKTNIIWQRNYHDHIIRNDHALNNIRNYIKNNPKEWEMKKTEEKY